MTNDTKNSATLFLRKEYVAVLFVALVIASFVFHASRRSDNFQECDSSAVYEALYHFPTASFSFTWSASVAQKPFISEDMARAIIATAPARRLIDAYKSQYGTVREDVLNDRLIRAITHLTPLSAVRFGYLALLSRVHLPHAIESFFALPTASTYSAGAGLFYGLVSSRGMPYGTFMDHALLLTLFLFHLAAVLIFLTGRRLKLDPRIACIGGTAFLFSVSLYSYAYHLGSTVWNMWSGALWLWCLIRYEGKPAFALPSSKTSEGHSKATEGKPAALRNISVVTALLIFFNYLIACYWLAFAATYLQKKMQGIRIVSRSGGKMLLREVVTFLRTQKHVLIAALIVLAFFYPPGQGRGEVSYVLQAPSHFYYLILNFVGFFNHNPVLNAVQFAVGFAILAFGLWRLLRRTQTEPPPDFSDFRRTLAGIFIIYLILILFGILPFLPSRHALFIAPAVFVVLMVGLDDLAARFRVPRSILYGVGVLLVVAGIAGVGMRAEAMNDKVPLISVPRDVEKVVTYPDCSFHIAYHDFKTPVPFEAIKPTTFVLKEGSVYGYASQGPPLQDTLQFFRDKNLYPNMEVEILSDFRSESDVCFLGYFSHPAVWTSSMCGYGDLNNIYFSKFKVKKF